jgi:hypothetical protein
LAKAEFEIETRAGKIPLPPPEALGYPANQASLTPTSEKLYVKP